MKIEAGSESKNFLSFLVVINIIKVAIKLYNDLH